MKINHLSLVLVALFLLPIPVLAETVSRKTAVPRTVRQSVPAAPAVPKALAVSGSDLELAAPVVLKVAPEEVVMKNAVITVRGQNFGANQSGGRKVILTRKQGGMQVLPVIDSWKNNRITFKAPDLSGLYLLQVDNASPEPLSNAAEIMLGVRQKDIRVDFTPVFGGTRLDNSNVPYFYLGPAGGAPNDWRALFATEVPDFPRLLTGGDKRKVVSRAWSDKKNTLYDISIRCYLRLKSAPAQPSFDSNNHLVFSIPYTADIKQTASIFWYHTQDADPYRVKNPLLTEPMQGRLTIRVPLEVREVAGKKKILSNKAKVTLDGALVIKSPWPDNGLEPQLQRDWATAKTLLRDAIAENFAESGYRMSIFGQEFSSLIQSLTGPGATILRFKTTGSHTMRVYYLD